MPQPTPFHPRTSALCKSLFWKEWAGYHAVRSYDTCHEQEYMAIRHGAALIDVTPLYKYEVTGTDAEKFLSRVMAKNIAKLKLGRVTYCCWCDDEGKVVDDGTVSHLGENTYRVTAAEPTLSWLLRQARSWQVEVEESTDDLGALAIQGPKAREVLKQVTDVDMDALRYFGVEAGRLDGVDVHISRTGYTGDLGYEVWVPRKNAVAVWDAIMDGGKNYGLKPAGLDAMDVSRIEAGFIMNGVDYFSAHQVLTEARKSTPYEIGLGWTVNLKRDPFIGQEALKAEKVRGPKRSLVCLAYDWVELEDLFAEYDLPPQVCSSPWRGGVPVYKNSGDQVGYATCGAWSPMVKKNLALATVKTEHAKVGTRLQVEVTVEFERRKVGATVVESPCFNPERKRA